MSRSFWMAIGVLVLVELGAFAWWHDDAVALSGSRARLMADGRFPEMATRLIARDRVSRRLLERVADIAAERGDVEVKVLALQRIAAAAPGEAAVRLRLASALRDAGRLGEAERLFREELARATGEEGR